MGVDHGAPDNSFRETKTQLLNHRNLAGDFLKISQHVYVATEVNIGDMTHNVETYERIIL